MTPLQMLLTDAVEAVGTRAAVAARLGVSASRITRVLDGSGSFKLTTCLRLAHALGRSPVEVLRAAGKADEAALIGALAGADALGLTDDERRLVTALRALSPEARAGLRALAVLALAIAP